MIHPSLCRKNLFSRGANVVLLAAGLLMMVPHASAAQTADQQAQFEALQQQVLQLQKQLEDHLRNASPSLSDQFESNVPAVIAKRKTPPRATFNRDLSVGLRADAGVSRLQQFLADQGLYSNAVTGNFFSVTKDAVKKFQSSRGITPTGYFGPLTRGAANRILALNVRVPGAATATASAPVKNGLIIYSDFSGAGNVHNPGNGLTPGDGQIFTVMPDGSNRKQLTKTGTQVNMAPTWSWDGKKIAFTSTRTGTAQIWTMDADGGNQIQLTRTTNGAFQPSWSPDGKILFALGTNVGSEIWVMNADGSGQKYLKSINAIPAAASFSPDGTKIAFADQGSDGRNQIYVMNADGTDVKQLTFPTERLHPESNAPAWSPDGKKIVFFTGFEATTPTEKLPPEWPGTQQIGVINADGSNRGLITHCPPMCYAADNPAWSPDGKWVIFESGHGNTEAVDVSGNNNYQILPIAYGAGRLPWQPMQDVSVASAVLITPAKAIKVAKIPASAEIIYYAGAAGAVASPGSGPAHIYTMDRNGGSITQITFENPRQWEHVAVSHDRKYIAANEVRMDASGARSLLWLFDLEKGMEVQLVPDFHSAGGGGVDWDKDGDIYFAAQEKKSADIATNDIYRIKFDGTGLKRLIQSSDVGEADVSVSDDGALVAYATNANMGAIRIANSDGTNIRRIANSGTDPEISPDNTKVVFNMRNQEAPPNWPAIPGLNTAYDIWTANLDGTEPKRVTKPGPISIIADWKGNLIVFTELNERDNYKGASVINADGTGYKKLKEGAMSPKWIP